MTIANRARSLQRKLWQTANRWFARVDGWIAARYPIIWLTRAPAWMALAVGASILAVRAAGRIDLTGALLDAPAILLVSDLWASVHLLAFLVFGVMKSITPGRLRGPFRERVFLYFSIVGLTMAATIQPFVFAHGLLPRVAALETPDAIARLLATHEPHAFWLCAPGAAELRDALKPRLGAVLTDLRHYGFESDGTFTSAAKHECAAVGRPLSPSSVSLNTVMAGDPMNSPNVLVLFRKRIHDIADAQTFSRDGSGSYRRYAAAQSWQIPLLGTTFGAFGMLFIWMREQCIVRRMGNWQTTQKRGWFTAIKARIDGFFARRYFVLWSARIPAVASNLMLGVVSSIVAREIPAIVVLSIAGSGASLLGRQSQARGLSADLRTELGTLGIHALVVGMMTMLAFVLETKIYGSISIWPYVFAIGTLVCAIAPSLRLGSRLESLGSLLLLVVWVAYLVALMQLQLEATTISIGMAQIALSSAAFVMYSAWPPSRRAEPEKNRLIVIIPSAMALTGVSLVVALFVEFGLDIGAVARGLCVVGVTALAFTAFGVRLAMPLRRFRRLP